MASSDESNVDGELDDEYDGLECVIQKVSPFMKDTSEDSIENLRTLLESYNVQNLSDFQILKQSHLSDLFPVVNFLKMKNALCSPGNETSKPGRSQEYVLNIKSLLAPKFYEELALDKNILTSQNRRKLIDILGDDIRDNVRVVCLDLLLRIASQLVNAYPTSMGCIRKDKTEKREAAASLSFSLKNRVDYLNSLKRKQKSDVSNHKEKKGKKATKAQNYGIDPEIDLPNELPLEETPASQEIKRTCLVKMSKTGESINLKCVQNMMRETFSSQRTCINSLLPIEQILSQWPYIGEHSILESHFEKLMSITVSEVTNDFGNLLPNLQKFFEAESSGSRKGKVAKVPGELHRILLAYLKSNKSDSLQWIAVILCCMAFMDIDMNNIFILFEETTSFDEVQASEKLPDHGKPVIAVLGNDVQLNPMAYIVIEKRIISEVQITVSKAIFVMFMSYFVFKIEYDPSIAPILDFIQRQVFKIQSEGTRVGRKKTSKGYSHAPVKGPTRKYLNLMQKFRQYCTKWNISL